MTTRGRPAGWTDETIARLKDLWGQGLSSGQIASQMTGFTRNAIIGKALRLGLPARGRTKPSSDRKKKVKRPTARNVSLPPLPINRPDLVADATPARAEAWMPLPGTTPMALEDLGEIGRPAIGKYPARWGRCRWPIGQAPTLFCGCATDNVYCPTHAALARGKSEAAA